MKRHQARNKARSRKKIEALGPCTRYSTAMGINPFAKFFMNRMVDQVDNQEVTEEEKKKNHAVKMAADQKSAKAIQNRKRNKV